jgi:VWFA-related protein
MPYREGTRRFAGRRCLAAAAGAVALLLPASGRPSAQAGLLQTPVFRVGTDLVVVDLVATDREGRLVADLSAADVQVLEDGRPHPVQLFQLVQRDLGGPSGAGAVSTGATTAVAAPGAVAPPEATAPEFVMLDVQGMSGDVLLRTRDAVTRTLADLPAGARVTVARVDHGLVVSTPSPMTPAEASAALRDSTAPTGRRSFMEFAEQVERVCGESGPEDPEAKLQQAIILARTVLDELQVQVRTATEAIAALSRALGSTSGRKHVVFYSAGYPPEPVGALRDTISALCPRGRRGFEDFVVINQFDPHGLVSAAVDGANRNQVSVYAVDARGLVTGTPEARQTVSGRSLAAGGARTVGRTDTVATQESLVTLAADTGGRAFLNTNDLTRGMRRA